MQGTIFDIKELGIHDGDGLVTTVFFKGCPLRCKWCHNPEGQSFESELMIRVNSCKRCGLCDKKCNHEECKPFNKCLHICPDNLISKVGEKIEAKDLANRILKNKNIIDSVTFSGGEPLAQPEFILEVISYLENIKINIETSGYVDNNIFIKILDKVDFIYYDLKLVDDKQHIKYTGVSNKLILENLNTLINSNKNHVIRTPLIPNITDTKENLDSIKQLIGNSKHELLPYNDMAIVKYKMLNKNYELDDIVK